MDSLPACYTDTTSAAPGEAVRLFASAAGPCSLRIERVGAGRTTVLELDGIVTATHGVPPDAVSEGCRWPEVVRFNVGEHWVSGYYDVILADASGAQAHHFLVVRSTLGPRRTPYAFVLTTNTWQAYNHFGGQNAYCDVAALMAREKPLAEAMKGAVGRLCAHRPYPPLLLAPPQGMPRLVNMRKRGFEERPWAGADPAWSRAHGQSPYDGSAGFLGKWEHVFAAWAEAEGIELDYLTDRDLEDAAALDGYRCALFVGHSEYWSGPQRDTVEAFVDGGGRLAILSGNTAFWKVRWDGETMACHKWRGEAEGVDVAAMTHLWSHPAFGRPEAELTGLSFIFGGYHRLGLCAARGAGGYTIYRPDHWALAGTDLYYGDVIGDEAPLLGYENDGCAITFGEDGLPAPVARLGVPEGLEIIGFAPAAFAEAESPYRSLIPPEELDVVARIAFGDDRPETQARVLRGHAVMASFRRGAGEVFNAGTTEWAHGLGARDPFVTRITRNVLGRFGT